MATSSNPDEPLVTIVCFDPKKPDHPCPICGGIGLVRYDVPPEHPHFGKMFRCPNNPVDQDEKHLERLRKISNLSALADKTLENFDIVPGGDYTTQEQQSLEFAFARVKDFINTPEPNPWIFLQGTYGCGKTHLAAAIGNAYLQKGMNVLFITSPDLLDHLRGTYRPNSDIEYDELFERVKNVDVLILDDLGVENASDWANEKLFQLFNSRYTNRKITVITTNSDLEELDPRIGSRLQDNDVVRNVIIQARDYRTTADSRGQQLLSQLHLYRGMTFESFETNNNLSQDEQRNITVVAQYAYDFAQSPTGWILLTGTHGSGKTHLAAAIANFRQQSGEKVMFITTPDLLDYLRTTYAPKSQISFDKLFNSIRNVPLLVVDDMGTESATPWAKEKLFQLLDYRYVAKLPTVLTASKRIDDFDDRLRSRLLDQRICQILYISVPSYAIRMNRST